MADTNNHLIRTVDPRTGATQTLALRGVEKLRPSAPLPTPVKRLREQTVAPGSGELRIQVKLPEGHTWTEGAPSRATVSSSDTDVVEVPGQGELALTEAEVLPLIFVGVGRALLEVRLELYYCSEGEKNLCLFDETVCELPVRVEETTSESTLILSYSPSAARP